MEDKLNIKLEFTDVGGSVAHIYANGAYGPFHVTLNPTVMLSLCLNYDIDVKEFFSEVFAHELLHAVSYFFDLNMSEKDIHEVTFNPKYYKHTKRFFEKIDSEEGYRNFSNNFTNCFEDINNQIKLRNGINNGN